MNLSLVRSLGFPFFKKYLKSFAVPFIQSVGDVVDVETAEEVVEAIECDGVGEAVGDTDGVEAIELSPDIDGAGERVAERIA